MKRFAFSALIFAFAGLFTAAAAAAAAANTVVVKNETSICYTVDVTAYRTEGVPIHIGRERIDSKQQFVFKYSVPAGRYSLLVGADACFHGPMPGAAHAKNPRAHEVFSIVQPGQSVHIVRRP